MKVNTEQAARDLAADVRYSMELAGTESVTYRDCGAFMQWRGITSRIAQSTIIRVATQKGMIRWIDNARITA